MGPGRSSDVGTTGPLVDPAADVALLCRVLASAADEHVLGALRAEGYGDLRVAHGYVVQGLLAGDTTAAQLAQRLAVSPQAVAKTVAELEAAGYVARGRDAADGRARPIQLSERGLAMLAVSRRARAEVARTIEGALGAARTRRLVALLHEAVAPWGGADVIHGRRVRPVQDLR